MFFQPHFDFITILGEDLSRPLAGKIYFKRIESKYSKIPSSFFSNYKYYNNKLL